MAQTAARGAETVEWLKCDADAAYFLDSYGWIDDPQGDGASATVRFRLWPAQVQTMWQLMLHRLIVILKARQLGISERTVNGHLSNIYRKLGARGRTEAVALAFRAGQ